MVVLSDDLTPRYPPLAIKFAILMLIMMIVLTAVIKKTMMTLIKSSTTIPLLIPDLFSCFEDPIAARERRLNEVDRRRLEDIADIFMRMPHEGKRPSVQYINALARKNRRQHSVESTPRQTPQYDSEDSFIGTLTLQ